MLCMGPILGLNTIGSLCSEIMITRMMHQVFIVCIFLVCIATPYFLSLPAIHVVSYENVVMILVYIPIYVKFFCFSCLRDYQSLRKSSAKTSVTTKQVTTFVTSIVVTNSNVFFIAEKKGKKHFFKCILCYSLPIQAVIQAVKTIQAVIHATTDDGNMVVYRTIISRDAYLWLVLTTSVIESFQ